MNKIPKIIHYCWFGNGKLGDLEKKCIESWYNKNPDYEIKLWNENNFDIQDNKYATEAYDNKKWAFVSDYARLVVLEKYGGVYLDTDMEVLVGLESFIKNSAFLGYENDSKVAAGIIGAEKNHSFIKLLKAKYDNEVFIETNKLNMKTIVERITELLEEEYNLNNNNSGIQQLLKNDLMIYPRDYFYPVSMAGKKKFFTNNTATIHHYSGSWLPNEVKVKNFLRNFIGDKIYEKVKSIIKI